jgi:hypothetical protein
LIKHPVLMNAHGSLKSLKADFGDRVNVHIWDVNTSRYTAPKTIKNADDGFSGNREHLEWKVDIATQEAKLLHDARVRVAEQILEDKNQAVDPLSSFACVANSTSEPAVYQLEKPSILSRWLPSLWGNRSASSAVPKQQTATLH